jgi:TM2 domain-containing membrane protein YozV
MKNRFVAALLAFFLGSFGIHKFYLGQNGWGLAYLLFFWTGIPWLAGLCEAFGLLVFTSDESFDQQFNTYLLGRLSLPAGRDAKDITSALGDLKRLYDGGALTAEEYEEKRRKLLNDL